MKYRGEIYYSEREAAKILGISRQSLLKYRASDLIRPVVNKRLVLYSKSELSWWSRGYVVKKGKPLAERAWAEIALNSRQLPTRDGRFCKPPAKRVVRRVVKRIEEKNANSNGQSDSSVAEVAA